jgi:hypothetical protein
LKELEGIEASRRCNRLIEMKQFIEIVNLRIAGEPKEFKLLSLEK